MEQYRQQKQDRLELESHPPLIPSQRRILPDDDMDTDLSIMDMTSSEPSPPPKLLLSERDSAILTFEKQWWRHAGAKEQAIRDQFGLSGTRYYQLLNSLLDNPGAIEQDPVLVARLRRLRGSRSRSRGLKGS